MNIKLNKNYYNSNFSQANLEASFSASFLLLPNPLEISLFSIIRIDSNCDELFFKIIFFCRKFN